MGIKRVLGVGPVDAAKQVLGSLDDRARRQDASLRVSMYQDSCESDLQSCLNDVFNAEAVRKRIRPFIPMACATSIAKRIVDEIARHVYNPMPGRRVSSPEGAVAYQTFVNAVRLDQRLDQAARLLEMCNAVALFPRWSAGLQKPVLDIMTPDMFSVIPHPDDPTSELAIIFDVYSGGEHPHREIWDDEEITRIDAQGKVVPVDGQLVRPNPWGILPQIVVHKRERWGTYWDLTSGKDLVAAQRAVGLLSALVLKLHKSQGEKQIVVTGDTAHTIQDQTLDGEGALVSGDGVTITTLDLRSDANHYNSTIDSLIQRVAANYGISKERLNANHQQMGTGSDTALFERRAELLQTWAVAERRLFDVCKVVFAGTSLAIPADDEMLVDFREIEARVSMSDQLDLWERQLSMGLKSVEDMVMSMNREITTEDEAHAEVARNLESWARWVEKRRELNAPDDAGSGDLGKSPEDNGADGPKVRDGVDVMADGGTR